MKRRRCATLSLPHVQLTARLLTHATPPWGNFRYVSSKKGEGAPFRYPLEWGSPEFYDEEDLERETRRVFDVCHGCRRCYSLCNSFPRLFSLVDNSKTGELDSVPSNQFKSVVDDCTLCDMCFIAKCPYVPPHSLNIDFPHLMLRYRAVEHVKKSGPPFPPPPPFPVMGIEKNSANTGEKTEFTDQVKPGIDRKLKFEPASFVATQITQMDRNSSWASRIAPLANWVTKTNPPSEPPRLSRRLLEQVLGIHKEAELPKYVTTSETLVNIAAKQELSPNKDAPAFKSKRKVVLYATCSGNWNKPSIGLAKAARKVLCHNGVEVKVVYPGCCGMPQLEQGNLSAVATQAKLVSSYLVKWINDGWTVVSIVPSCVLMLKQEWSAVLPQDPDVQRLKDAAKDISEYIVDIANKEGLTPGLQPLDAGVSLHNACHSHAQNVGFKAEEMLSLIPGLSVSIVENCSGHGGSWGVKKETFPTAMKVGERAVKKTLQNLQSWTDGTEKKKEHYLSSECPLAADHIKQGLPQEASRQVGAPRHPIELLALSYRL